MHLVIIIFKVDCKVSLIFLIVKWEGILWKYWFIFHLVRVSPAALKKQTHSVDQRTGDVLSAKEAALGSEGQPPPYGPSSPEVVVMPERGPRNNSNQCFPEIKVGTSSPLWVSHHAHFLGVTGDLGHLPGAREVLSTHRPQPNALRRPLKHCAS